MARRYRVFELRRFPTEPDEIARLISYTPDEERAVVRKLDRRLVLFVTILYMLTFLDRSSKH